MISLNCPHSSYKKSGKTAAGTQRYKCKSCGVRFSDEAEEKPLGNLLIDMKTAELILGMLLEGMSVRACNRLTGVDTKTIGRLILQAGKRCKAFMDSRIVDVEIESLELDEIWSRVKMSERVRKMKNHSPEYGDSWTYIALSEKKLVVAFHIGKRDSGETSMFLSKVRRAIDTTRSFNVSSDGWASHKFGVPFSLGSNVNFGMLVKKYQSSQDVTRYSPARIISAERRQVFGTIAYEDVCTSHIESFNQKMRMHLKRFTRLSNALSKTVEHHEAMQNIFFCWFNFSRVHMSLDKKTPAMASGLTERPLKIRELLS